MASIETGSARPARARVKALAQGSSSSGSR